MAAVDMMEGPADLGTGQVCGATGLRLSHAHQKRTREKMTFSRVIGPQASQTSKARWQMLETAAGV